MDVEEHVNKRLTSRLALTIGALALLATGATGCRAEADLPGLEILPGMVDSVPVDPYDRDPLGKGHYSIYKAPEGSVPHGYVPFRYGKDKKEAERAGRELLSPLQGSAADLKRGQFVFDTWCAVCHGPKGEGDGPVIGAGRFPGPPSLLADRARNLADGHLFHIVTHGQGIMPSYAVQVRPADRWKAIAWVRKLQGQGGAK